MKKSIKTFYLMFFAGLLFISACQKSDLSDKSTVEQDVVMLRQAATGLQQVPSNQPNAKVTLSNQLLNELKKGKYLLVKQNDMGLYEAKNVVEETGIAAAGPTDPVDPCADLAPIFAQFEAFLAANRHIFQAWANRYCRPYIACWSDPNNCICIMFIVHPTVVCVTELVNNETAVQ